MLRISSALPQTPCHSLPSALSPTTLPTQSLNLSHLTHSLPSPLPFPYLGKIPHLSPTPWKGTRRILPKPLLMFCPVNYTLRMSTRLHDCDTLALSRQIGQVSSWSCVMSAMSMSSAGCCPGLCWAPVWDSILGLSLFFSGLRITSEEGLACWLLMLLLLVLGVCLGGAIILWWREFDFETHVGVNG
jgi:hypothetical protein